MQVPIYVADNVLEEAGLIPEDDLSEVGLDEEMDSDRLSVFENYLDQITPDQPDDQTDEEESEEE
jgi:hypothetical protein